MPESNASTPLPNGESTGFSVSDAADKIAGLFSPEPRATKKPTQAPSAKQPVSESEPETADDESEVLVEAEDTDEVHTEAEDETEEQTEAEAEEEETEEPDESADDRTGLRRSGFGRPRGQRRGWTRDDSGFRKLFGKPGEE